MKKSEDYNLHITITQKHISKLKWICEYEQLPIGEFIERQIDLCCETYKKENETGIVYDNGYTEVGFNIPGRQNRPRRELEDIELSHIRGV